MRTSDTNSKVNATIYDWSLLNREHKDIVQEVLEEWQRLIVSGKTEPHFQRFISDHAGMFFGGDGTSFAIRHLQLGSEREPDFVILRDGRSAGLHYEFIELKRPDHSPYITRGMPSQYLVKADEQIRRWRDWLEKHASDVSDLLPSKHIVSRSCSFTTIIGRRENSKAWLEERNCFGIQNRVHVRSYDYLTDQLSAKQFRHSCPSTWAHGDDWTLNRLANPFAKAFTHKSWREFVRRLGQSSSEGTSAYELHFLTLAGKVLAESLKTNNLFYEFARRHKTQTRERVTAKK